LRAKRSNPLSDVSSFDDPHRKRSEAILSSCSL
jgi:hypothetical protein